MTQRVGLGFRQCRWSQLACHKAMSYGSSQYLSALGSLQCILIKPACSCVQWSRQPSEGEQQHLLRALQHEFGPGASSVQQPVTPAQPEGIALPMGATPISLPGSGALPPVGLPPGVVSTHGAPLAAEQQPPGWHAAGSQPMAPRPPRPLPRLLPKPSAMGAASTLHSVGAAAHPANSSAAGGWHPVQGQRLTAVGWWPRRRGKDRICRATRTRYGGATARPGSGLRRVGLLRMGSRSGSRAA